MIEKIYLENFKCFQSQSFNLANLTVFCGCNSSGKSTVIQSILAIKQSIKNFTNEAAEIQLNGNLFKFGTVLDIYNRRADSSNFQIHINDIKFKATYDTKIKDLRRWTVEPIVGGIPNLFLNNDFVYLSAERLGPKLQHNISTDYDTLNLGVLGENALYEYHKRQNSPVKNQEFAKSIFNAKLSQEDKIDIQQEIFLNRLVEVAMQRVYPAYAMKIREDKESDLVANSFYVQEDPNKLPIRPNNIGFGVSCVLPVIIACCCIQKGGVLIVENPEIHLHPKAQAELIKILAILSLCGVQVILETHSDHIINGLRLFIKKYSEQGNNISENFIIYSINNSEVTEIKIDKDGYFNQMDDDFFDQIMKDLGELI